MTLLRSFSPSSVVVASISSLLAAMKKKLRKAIVGLWIPLSMIICGSWCGITWPLPDTYTPCCSRKSNSCWRYKPHNGRENCAPSGVWWTLAVTSSASNNAHKVDYFKWTRRLPGGVRGLWEHFFLLLVGIGCVRNKCLDTHTQSCVCNQSKVYNNNV